MLLICALLTIYTWSMNTVPAKITAESKIHTLARIAVDEKFQPILVESSKTFDAVAKEHTSTSGTAGTAKVVMIEKLNIQTAKPQAVPAVIPATAIVPLPAVVTGEPVLLEISNILQKPELPNGCEATSLSMVLAYKGFNVSKSEIASKYLPKAKFYRVGKERKLASSDPNDFYIGDPASEDDAYYCYAKPLAQAGNAYLQDVGSALIAKDITGADEQALINALAAGNPVIAWVTINMGNAVFYSDKPLIINKQGDVHTPFANLHCVVLTGYDNEFFYYSDPLLGNAKSKRKTFINAYNQIGSRAVIIE